MGWTDYYKWFGSEKTGSTYINPTFSDYPTTISNINPTWTITTTTTTKGKIHYHCARTGRRWK